MKTTAFTSLVSLLLVCSFSFNSCQKKGPTNAEITTVDKNGNPVAGASVRVYCTSGSNTPCAIESKQTSDASGKSVHEFKLPAVLKVHAEKATTVSVTDTTTNPPTITTTTITLIGDDYVKLEEHQTVQKTVTLL